jgi:hypothetical protein
MNQSQDDFVFVQRELSMHEEITVRTSCARNTEPRMLTKEIPIDTLLARRVLSHMDLKANPNAMNTCVSGSSLHTCIDIVITKRQCITKVEY